MSATAEPGPGELRPSSALVTPLFLAALVTLVLNDHVLKGAGLLPGWLTGKLSDFAGLVVLPVVLAVLLRVRTRRGVVLTQLLGVAFLAALQLSAGFVAAWEAALARVGIPWHTTMDPTDLVAVLVLVPVWRWVVPTMEASRAGETRRRGPALVRLALIGASVPALLATSQPVCRNFTEEEAVVPHDTAPRFPGPLTGAEVLARVSGSHGVPASWTPPQSKGEPCPELVSHPDTTVTWTVDETRAVTRHRTIDVDETVAVKDCQPVVEGTTVTVLAPVTVETADGLFSFSDTVPLGQAGPADAGVVTWTSSAWTDNKADTLWNTLRKLGLPAKGTFVGMEVTWAENTGGKLTLIRQDNYKHCTALSWPAAP